MQEFFAMGGYAPYVWGSFGVTALLMVVEPLLVRHRRRQLLQRLNRSRDRARTRNRLRQEKMATTTTKVEHETQT